MEHNQIVINWKEFKIPALLEREHNIKIDTDFITTIIGPRRAGKTYFCFQLIKKLLDDSISKENILYINFEDNKLLGANADDLDKMLDSFLELYEINPKQKIYFFLDEIQTVVDWDAWVRKIHDTRKEIILVVTGSSSKMLSKEISTKLRGRVITAEIWPLSFKELLKWNKLSYNLKTISHSQERIPIKKLFTQFLFGGGYPALMLNKDIQKEAIFQSYYESMIFKDVIERYRIEDTKKLKILAQLLFESVSREMSYNKLADKLNSLGFKTSKSTIIEYISYFEDAYLFFQNMKYEYSLAAQIGSIKKVYCVDNGLLNSVSFKFSEDRGGLLENCVFIELKRRKKNIYYHRKNNECDFIIVKKNKVVSAIQVTAKLSDENLNREINGLLEALNEHDLSEGLILTEDQEETRKIDNKSIRIMPAWKWMLLNNDN